MSVNPFEDRASGGQRGSGTSAAEASGGPFGWWYALVAPRVTSAEPSLAERELLRRGRLAALLLLAIIALGLAGLPVATANPSKSALYGDIIGLVGCGIGLALNRRGMVTAAGGILAGLLVVGFAGIVATTPGGLGAPDLVLLPLLAQAELVAVSLLAPWSVFLVALVNSVFVVYALLALPLDDTLKGYLAQPADAALIIAPLVALYLIVAIVTYLWVRGATQALVARDRAEEVAALEHVVAEQRRNLEIGVRQLLDTHVRVANGDLAARAPVTRENELWQVGVALNNLINRLQKANEAQFLTQRTAAEVARVVLALRDARNGRPPLWPAESGTLVDPIITELAGPRARAFPQGESAPSLRPMEQQQSGMLPPYPNQPPSQFPQQPPQQPSQTAPEPWPFGAPGGDPGYDPGYYGPQSGPRGGSFK